MPFKSRKKSDELIILEALYNRGYLTGKDERHYLNLKKGFEGELQFDALTVKLQCQCLILNDLLLELGNTTFQIDSLIIFRGKIYMYEIKNYEGDHYYEAGKLYKKNKMEVINPLHQLGRAESLLGQLLLSIGYKPQIQAFVFFVNPSFMLYQAPKDKPFIFPPQIKRHMQILHATTSKLTEIDKRIADQLLSLHITDSPFKKIPSYEYDLLQKGIVCPQCHSLALFAENRKCVCRRCGYIESTNNAVLRNVNEFKILFPNEKITTNVIYDWCQLGVTKQTIRNILSKNFSVSGVHQWAYYE